MAISTTFINDESGAVTADWVVLTAAIIGLGVAVMSSVGAGATDLADDVQSNLTGTEIASYIPAEFLGIYQSVVTERGNNNCEGLDVCGPYFYSEITYYEMPDGEVLHRFVYVSGFSNTVTIENGNPHIDEWYNWDGDGVDVPDGFAG